MISQEQADEFARDWISAWNSHDVEAILAHYDEDIEFSSPLIPRILEGSAATIRGKEAFRRYFKTGLPRFPDLEFKLQEVFAGVDTITIRYISVNDMHAAEVFELSPSGLVRRVLCHYSNIG